jgi:flagellar biosynthesis protein FliQ
MSIDAAHDVLQTALSTVFVLTAPLLAVVLLVSLIVNILQTMTQLHDHTLSFVPRLVIAGATALVLLPWLLGRLSDYATDVYRAAGR